MRRLLLIGAGLLCGAVEAQTVGVRTLPGETTCSPQSRRCMIPVYVQPLRDMQGNEEPAKCFAQAGTTKIIVKKPDPVYIPSGKIRVVWHLIAANKNVDLDEYSFPDKAVAPQTGQSIAGQFEDEMHEADGRRYVWVSRHPNNFNDIKFDIKVRRKTRGAGDVAVIEHCDADPTITNSN